MKYLVVGLGNPGREYERTRHNVGRMAVSVYQKAPDGSTAKFLTPDTMMNNSGKALPAGVKPAQVVVVHDEIDLPLGVFKISFDRGSGGHRGVESIIKTLKSRAFTRVRIGISAVTPSGKFKKPPQAKVVDFILGQFRPPELTKLKSVIKKTIPAIETIIKDGPQAAMNKFN
jgi:PTH1 family peptidyl-tRNA hydrolase